MRRILIGVPILAIAGLLIGTVVSAPIRWRRRVVL